MSQFGQYLRKLRKERNLTINQLALYSGVSSALISRIENGQRGRPKPDTLKKLASALKVPYEDLLLHAGVLNEQISRTSESRDLKPVDPSWYKRQVPIPVLGSIRAGTPVEMLALNSSEFVLVDSDLLGNHEGFALEVVGDSMIGDYIFPGDLVIVKYTSNFSPQDICVVAINGEEATLKRVKCQGDICILTPSNPSMEPMVYNSVDVHVIGVVVEVRRRLRNK
ncbi:transcriptional regulator, XRE family (plasmid) [Alicyclobacillus acidocaldarius subsp. acidocaldarius DSM 446]|uniref:Transcriptional regulator, XRE family n=1 Tax=Alicyclobacillus acidocaldarius subsp. acidocaldarius (strain ATCC 27009 / DSM 446 / BCRC 14685 / JCM 5260 / KCTC 1825 / NBRC 15652 / NCIMB 11725 / NRRL B-14509 / 104-IA) TaxID=521098 RepID=C8WY63_ALIAD|nr:transcriptional regulator, XRE family [Alicyclobacillus acidocaldarius subsp. acidocaldarius DSM 446]